MKKVLKAAVFAFFGQFSVSVIKEFLKLRNKMIKRENFHSFVIYELGLARK